MSAGNRFGRLISNIDVEAAAEATIRAWAPDYLAEVAQRYGHVRGALPNFLSVLHSTDIDRMPEDMLPCLVIMCPGTIETYVGRNGTSARWDLRLGAFASARTRDETLRLTQMYVAALRWIIVQHPGLGGDPRDPGYEPFATSTIWNEDNSDIIEFESGRTMGGGAVLCTVTTEGVVDSTGPTEPSVDATIDPGPWPTVDPTKISVSIQVEE